MNYTIIDPSGNQFYWSVDNDEDLAEFTEVPSAAKKPMDTTLEDSESHIDRLYEEIRWLSIENIRLKKELSIRKEELLALQGTLAILRKQITELQAQVLDITERQGIFW